MRVDGGEGWKLKDSPVPEKARAQSMTNWQNREKLKFSSRNSHKRVHITKTVLLERQNFDYK